MRTPSLTIKMFCITVGVGLITWALVDIHQSRIMGDLFQGQLREQLRNESMLHRVLLNNYIQRQQQLAKIIASQERIAEYLRHSTAEWGVSAKQTVETALFATLPEWMPQPSVVRSFLKVHSVLLLDKNSEVREIFQAGVEPLPSAFVSGNQFLARLSHTRQTLTTFGETAYLVSLAPVLDVDQTILAAVVVVTVIDDDFLKSAIHLSPDGTFVVLLGSGEKSTVLASASAREIPVGTSLDQIEEKFQVTGASFLDYGFSDAQVQFATLISVKKFETLLSALQRQERKSRFNTALILVFSFSLLMLWVTEKIRLLTHRVVDLTATHLGKAYISTGPGDEMKTLESAIQGLGQAVFSYQEKSREHVTLLRMERDRARNYLDIAGVIIVSLDREGVVDLINRRGCSILGRSEGEIVGRDWFASFIPKRYQQAKRDVFRSVMAGSADLQEFYEDIILSENSEERMIAWHNAVLKDSGGKVVGVLSSGEDITARRGAEEKIMEQNLFLHSVIEAMPYPFYVIDAKTYMIKIANSATGTLGMGSTLTTCHQLSHKSPVPCSSEKDPCPLEEVRRTGRPTMVEHVHFDRNDNVKNVEVYASPIFDARGSLVEMIEFSIDVTDRKNTEAEKERLIEELQAAVDEIKQLRGIIPICMYCKNIRDDGGGWQQLESYIHQHSDAEFSHGICPKCLKEKYPDLDDQDA